MKVVGDRYSWALVYGQDSLNQLLDWCLVGLSVCGLVIARPGLSHREVAIWINICDKSLTHGKWIGMGRNGWSMLEKMEKNSSPTDI